MNNILNENLKKGFIYTAIGKISYILVNLLINAALSRILTPKEYGIVAVCQVFILFFQMIVEAGMGPAIIQNKELDSKEIGILFNYSVVIAVTMAILFGIFGNVLVFFYNNAIYSKLAWLMAISIFFNGLNVVPTAVLNREKSFKIINVNQVIANCFSGITGILLAIKGFGVYALIFSAITLALTSLILNGFRANLNFVCKLDNKVLKKILAFSSYQFSFNFINYFSRNGDNILIGKFLGTTDLGNYNKAYQLLMMPNSVLLGLINPVLQPVLSDYQDNVLVIRETYLKLVRLLALIGMPLSVYLVVFAKQVVFFVYGSQWGDAVIPFQVLASTVWVQMTLSSSGAIFQARNKPKELYTTSIYSAAILISSFSLGIALDSLNKLAFVLTIGFYVNYLVNFRRVMKLALNAKLMVLTRELRVPFLFAFVELLLLGISEQILFRFFSNNLVVLFVSGIEFVIIFMILLVLTSEYKRVKKLLKIE
ncbi:lipopolysaccharide biosynthesis protein [Lactiplantibacillus argentoratensis]|uniref:lipopolysaccharide biosynthesis protein n=1 Tax=Lactiplantibacillus argentoratensis TaxID=271881 RepID=UPI003F52A92F